MPTVSYSTLVRAASDNYTLALGALHCVALGYTSEVPSNQKSRFPDDIDILLASDLVLAISGVVDGVKITPELVAASAVAHHLQNYLSTNASTLGLNAVSEIYIDPEDGQAKLTLTSSRSTPHGARPRHATLLAINITYKWKTISRKAGESSGVTEWSGDSHPFSHPFSPMLLLPFENLLNNVVERFAAWHLVRRYPLIFGPWCKNLDTEATCFPIIARSLTSVIKRSTVPTKQKKCMHYLKTIRQQQLTAFEDADALVSSYASASANVAVFTKPTLTAEAAICLSLERLYRDGARRPHYRGVVSGNVQAANTDRHEDDGLSQDLLASNNPSYSTDYVMFSDEEKENLALGTSEATDLHATLTDSFAAEVQISETGLFSDGPESDRDTRCLPSLQGSYTGEVMNADLYQDDSDWSQDEFGLQDANDASWTPFLSNEDCIVTPEAMLHSAISQQSDMRRSSLDVPIGDDLTARSAVLQDNAHSMDMESDEWTSDSDIVCEDFEEEGFQHEPADTWHSKHQRANLQDRMNLGCTAVCDIDSFVSSEEGFVIDTEGGEILQF